MKKINKEEMLWKVWLLFLLLFGFFIFMFVELFLIAKEELFKVAMWVFLSVILIISGLLLMILISNEKDINTDTINTIIVYKTTENESITEEYNTKIKGITIYNGEEEKYIDCSEGTIIIKNK